MNVSIENLPKSIQQHYKAQSSLHSNHQECQPPSWVIDRSTPHPSTPLWFEWKLAKVHEALSDRFFGYTYGIVSKKMLKREKNENTLVEALLCFEKHCNENNKLPTEFLNPYNFLKLVLEENASLFGFEEELFGPIGIKRDRSKLFLPQKNMISLQCAAQVLWHLDGSKSPTIESMKRHLLKKEPILFQLLELSRFNNECTIKNWIRPIFPVPPEERKSPQRRKNFDNIVPIPGVYSAMGINFPKLRFVAICISRILKTLEWQIDQINESTFIGLLSNPIHSYIRSYVNDWIREGYSSNGSIFDL